MDTADRPPRCPTCDSPQPSMHPAVSGGGEAILCPDAWHNDELARLAHQRLANLVDPETATTLDSVLERLFDRDELLTYSAFGSAL
jgi:hypothetical protein